MLSFFKRYSPLWSRFDQWVCCEFFVKEPINIPVSHSLKKPSGFFHKFVQNVPTISLSHSSRVLSKSTHWCDHNIPTEFFSKNSQRTQHVAQFHHELSKNPLGVWLSTLWSHQWVLYERTLDEWLRFLMGTLWSELWKKPEGSFTKYPLGTVWCELWKKSRVPFTKCPLGSWVGTFQKYSPCTQWVKWEQIDGFFWKILGMYPVGIGWANCFRNHNELTMYPLGKCPLAHSANG